MGVNSGLQWDREKAEDERETLQFDTISFNTCYQARSYLAELMRP